MRHRRRLIFCGIFLALASFAVLWRGREPTYDGLPLSHWVWILGGRSSDTQAASNAIVQIGTNSLPFLLRWTQHEQAQWRGELSAPLARLPYRWSRRLSFGIANPRSGQLASGSYEAFQILGPRITPALEDLCRLMNKTNALMTSARSTIILGWIGTNALPALLAVMQDPRHPCRPFAVIAVGGMPDIGDAAKLPVPAIIACLDDKNDAYLRLVAITALGKLKAVPELSVPALVSCLQSTNTELRVKATRALAEFGPQAIRAIPALTNALADSDSHVCGYAMAALHKIAPATFTNAPPPGYIIY